ncbi:LOW QUALITY PROTEIN: hypothetical protein HID58_047318, partial [Brassica napus]
RLFLNATSAIHFYFNNESGKSYLERTCGIGKGSTSGPTKYGGVKKIELITVAELNDRHEISTAVESTHQMDGATFLVPSATENCSVSLHQSHGLPTHMIGPSTMLTGDCWANFNLLFKPISLQLHCKITKFHSCILDNKSTTNVLPSIILRSSWSI